MRYPTLGLLAALSLAVSAAAGASALFDAQSILEMTITGPIDATIANKDEPEERPFVLTVDGVDHDVEIRVRGKSRARVCVFPPLRINFKKGGVDGTVFAGQDKLKLVTHCRRSERAEQNVLDEFAAYRIFNLLSDVSYRVRLARVRYRDSGSHDESAAAERYAFLIEANHGLAARAGGSPANLAAVTRSALNQTQASLVYVYQYLIGNTDWSLVTADGDDVCCHNGKLLDIDDEIYYVPYDFDLSGLVNASYAKPDPSLRIARVTRRRYRGYCTTPDALRGALDSILSRREEILDVSRELPDPSAKGAAAQVRYLERFFKEAENAGKLLGSFERRCL